MKKKKAGKKSLRSKVDEASIRRRHELIGIVLVAVAVLSVCGDERIKRNLEKVSTLIREAPGNSGGAEYILEYYRKKVRKCTN